MDMGIAVAVADIDLAARRHRDIGRVVERQTEARAVPFAQRRLEPAACIEDHHLMRVPVDQQHAVVGVDKDAMRVADLPGTPTAGELAVRGEHDDRRPGSLKRVDIARAIERELTDMAERHTVPLWDHAITARAQCHVQTVGGDLRIQDGPRCR
jgi:hypothetical protein